MTSTPLLIQALRGESVPRPPVWMMRQAGRYLPEYMVLRKKYDFFTRVETPELACEITLQPMTRIGPDAAILFSDILVIPQAMGLTVKMVESQGPYLPVTIQNRQSIDALIVDEAPDRLQYVYDALALVRKALPAEKALIGFAGAPFTLLCYMVEGKGSKAFDKAKQFCFSQPELAHALLQKITDVTIAYLKRQIAAGADCVQVFDSWSGLLSSADFDLFCKPYLVQIADQVSSMAPVILFPKGSWYALADLASSSASGLGVDWCISPQQARQLTGGNMTLQGNFDPNHLLKPIPDIVRETQQMIQAFGTQRYIANLGHGILPNVPVDHAKAFVETVVHYESPRG